MISLLQRVTRASVVVDNETVASIDLGVLALIGVEAGDSVADADKLARRVAGFRLFADADGRMNLDVVASGGAVLLVPQFTLAADTRRGRRAGFSTAAAPAEAQVLFERFSATLAREVGQGIAIEQGVFGAHMQVSLVNDGPVTFQLRSRAD